MNQNRNQSQSQSQRKSAPFRTADYQDVQVVLLDIEGTTSDIDFVKNVLFPYSARELRNFISQKKTQPKVIEILDDVRRELKAEPRTTEACIQQLLEWIEKDVKHPALKSLQGMIWRRGFEEGVFQAHIYDDLLPAWQSWKAAGLTLAIYSSGSKDAQILYFTHTRQGDLRPYLSAYFDLSTGSKRESKSYQIIADALKTPARQILFLSDVPAELDAAKTAGLLVAQIVRPGTTPAKHHHHFSTLTEI